MVRAASPHAVARSYGVSCVNWTPTRMAVCDRHHELELNLLQAGELTYLLGGNRVELRAGQLAAFWAGLPHQIIDFSPDCAYFVATLPIGLFLRWGLPDSLANAVLGGRVVVEEPTDGALFDRMLFGRWSEDLASATPERRSIFLLECQARLRRLASSLSSISATTVAPTLVLASTNDIRLAEKVARFVSDRCSGPIDAQLIADEFGIHPNTSMRIFKRAFGRTIRTYVTECRVFHAQQLLTTTNELIERIAYSSGFGSLSRFNEAFNEIVGCSPSEWRRRAAGRSLVPTD